MIDCPEFVIGMVAYMAQNGINLGLFKVSFLFVLVQARNRTNLGLLKSVFCLFRIGLPIMYNCSHFLSEVVS